jgi:small ligand-binding sensory domain FIST
VELRPEGDELAVLLRAAKQRLDECAIGAIRFHLDGRAYVLESGTAIRPAA